MHALILLLLSTQLPGTTTLRGTVVGAESGQPLGFSVVTLHPNGGQQFTSASGAFTFADIKAGTYVLSVRQIGYVPLDTQVVITADSTTVVHVTLRRLAIELPPVTITGQQCTNPGRPDTSDAALLAVFDQLQENARRFELLADSYPFRYTLELSERTVSQRGDTDRHSRGFQQYQLRRQSLLPIGWKGYNCRRGAGANRLRTFTSRSVGRPG